MIKKMWIRIVSFMCLVILVTGIVDEECSNIKAILLTFVFYITWGVLFPRVFEE